jgi:hypothetical protein
MLPLYAPLGNRNIIVLKPIKDTGNDMRSFRYDKGNCFLYDQDCFIKEL